MAIRYSLPEKSMSECKENLTFANLFTVEKEALAVANGQGSTMKMLMALPSLAHKLSKHNDNTEFRPTSMTVAAEEGILLFGLSKGKFGYSVAWLDSDKAMQIVADKDAPIEHRVYLAKQLVAKPESNWGDSIKFQKAIANFTPEQLVEIGVTPVLPVPDDAISRIAKSLAGLNPEQLALLVSMVKEEAPTTEAKSPTPVKAKAQNKK
jgi:hypothetical protein